MLLTQRMLMPGRSPIKERDAEVAGVRGGSQRGREGLGNGTLEHGGAPEMSKLYARVESGEEKHVRGVRASSVLAAARESANAEGGAAAGAKQAHGG